MLSLHSQALQIQLLINLLNPIILLLIFLLPQLTTTITPPFQTIITRATAPSTSCKASQFLVYYSCYTKFGRLIVNNLKFDFSNRLRTQRGAEYYIRLGKDSNDLDKILIVPTSWFSNDYLIFPDDKAKLLLRYEFFSNGKHHLKKEEFITASDLPRFLH